MAGACAAVAPEKPAVLSRFSADPAGLVGVDGRSAWGRRFRDVVRLHLSDLGGEDNVSQAALTIVRAAATLTVELERQAAGFAEAGGATADELDAYQRGTGALRRLLESIGLERRMRDVTPGLEDYIRGKGRAA